MKEMEAAAIRDRWITREQNEEQGRILGAITRTYWLRLAADPGGHDRGANAKADESRGGPDLGRHLPSGGRDGDPEL